MGSPGIQGPAGETIKLPQYFFHQLPIKVINFLNTGVTFTHWGSSNCPDRTVAVYSGFVSVLNGDLLCLIDNPINAEQNGTLLGFFADDVRCAVCYAAQQATVFMNFGSLSCPDGWIREYSGYLAGGATTICLSRSSEEDLPTGLPPELSRLTVDAAAPAGYIPGRLLTCSLCSM